MIPNITRGDKPVGLMKDLVGPGLANEHSDPHLVGGSPLIMAWYDDVQLDEETAVEIAREVDLHRRVLGIHADTEHVWHSSLSILYQDREVTTSMQVRDRSSRPSWPSWSRTTWRSFAPTLVSCQARSQCRQVTPDPKSSSVGDFFQAMPFSATNRIPSSTARSSTRGLPVLAFFAGGAMGSAVPAPPTTGR